MHILVVNDDGPPSQQSSPYVHSLVHNLQSAGHLVSVVLPNVQRSWIGKAHMVGATMTPSYFRPGTLHEDDGTVHEQPLPSHSEEEEWILVDGTPASCVQIGLFHVFQDRGKVDLVISGPNYGRNTTAIFALSSGTIGGAMEGAICGYKAISLSYAFFNRNHDPKIIGAATTLSIKLIEYLYNNWAQDVDLYSINVPLVEGVENNKIAYTEMLHNTWASGSCFERVDETTGDEGPDKAEKEIRAQGESEPKKTPHARYTHGHFKWAPKFTDVYESVLKAGPGNDGWAVKEGYTSVTPLRANFMHSGGIHGEIKLLSESRTSNTMEPLPAFYALVDTKDTYINPLILNALESLSTPLLITSLSDLPDPSTKVLQFRAYEDLDFEHVMAHPTTSLCNAYVIRKALIRKHYISTTISTWISKRPDSLLKDHFKPAVDFELDYAEFLDEALVEAYELHESFGRDEMREKGKRDWWILKPGMSDRGQGIRLFSSEEELREIFEGWEEEEPRSDEDDDEPSGIHKPEREEKGGIITSQLRHFIAQPYIHPPLLLPSSSNRKFHIRTYVLAVGSLQVYVYRDMLALFAAAPYSPPWETETTSGEIDLSAHLTNTCLQDGTREGSVRRFWDLEALPQFPDWKERAYDQIKSVTGKVFEAAARGMMVHFQTLPNVFEVFGLDFLVDGKGKAWLLEVNAFPDFRQTGEGLRDVVGGFFEGVVREGVMPFFDDGQWREERETREEKGLDRVLDIDLGRR